MRITQIPQRIRNVKRTTEIISVLSKYGLAEWLMRLPLDQLGLHFLRDAFRAPDGEALANHTHEARVRMVLTDLGSVFIKLGQILSTRPDLIGVAQAEELKKLQADVPADPPDVARRIVEEELGRPIEELYLEFEDKPIASASIGQVHRARMLTGEHVVVKVQHAGIADKVREDTEVMTSLAHLAQHIPDLALYRPVELVAEFQRTLRRELDFGREERNLLHFASQLADNPHVRVPAVYSDLCTPRVLTMEYLDGIKLQRRERLVTAGYDLEELARNGAELYLRMMFHDGFYHADPHPGNVVILPGNIIGLLDFGMVGRVDERLRDDIEQMLQDIVSRDAQHLSTMIMRVGEVPDDLDESGLGGDLADFVSHYGTQNLQEFDLSGALNEMVELIRRYHITLPAQAAMLLKTLIMLEGTAQLLSPNFSLMEVLQELHRDVLLRRLNPAHYFRKLRRVLNELEHAAEVMPRRLLGILRQIETGRFDIHLDHRRLGPSVNRLVIGLVVSALFLGSSLLLSMKVPPLIFHGRWFTLAVEANTWWLFGMHDISLMGLIGICVSFLIALRLLLAINKSGHLDHKE